LPAASVAVPVSVKAIDLRRLSPLRALRVSFTFTLVRAPARQVPLPLAIRLPPKLGDLARHGGQQDDGRRLVAADVRWAPSQPGG